MTADLFFLLTLIVKMAITAGFVVAATVTAERVGPLLADRSWSGLRVPRA